MKATNWTTNPAKAKLEEVKVTVMKSGDGTQILLQRRDSAGRTEILRLSLTRGEFIALLNGETPERATGTDGVAGSVVPFV